MCPHDEIMSTEMKNDKFFRSLPLKYMMKATSITTSLNWKQMSLEDIYRMIETTKQGSLGEPVHLPNMKDGKTRLPRRNKRALLSLFKRLQDHHKVLILCLNKITLTMTMKVTMRMIHK